MMASVEIETERIDDIVLQMEMMKQMGLPDLLNRHLPRHHKQTGLELGWVAWIWLSLILSQGDHRKVTVQGWREARRQTLETVCEIELKANDLNDDRLSSVR
jgi:transposase